MNTVKKTPRSLEFLYKNSFGKILRTCLIKPWASSLAGWLCNRKLSAYYIKPFINTYEIDMNEAALTISDYKTFNDFFTRRLKPHTRPFDINSSSIISPADGTIFVLENITQSMQFPVKESHFNLGTFLADETLAQNYEGGTLLLFRLAPWDYHRFHFPIDCIPSEAQIIKGSFESVHPLAYCCGSQPLTHNERHKITLKTDNYGEIQMISVGALFVGAIVETYQPYFAHKKGKEAGYFCFGGSTVVLLFQKNMIFIEPEFLKNSKYGKETPLKMGTTIAFKKECSKKGAL